MAAGGLVDGQLLGENDINTEPVDKAKDATKEKDSKFVLLHSLKASFWHTYLNSLINYMTPAPPQRMT